MRLQLIIATAVLALLAAGGSAAHAATLEPIGKFDQPIYVTSDPSSPSRLFVVEREGRIRQVQKGVVSTYANIEAAVSCCEGEGGLLSIAPAPDFGSSGRIYVFYTGTEQSPGEIRVAELKGGVLRNLLTIPHPIDDNHYGGQLQFGPEGDLFISTGDGGGPDDAHQNAQDLGSLLGKILRIDPNPTGPSPFYTVPAGNPFVGQAGAEDEIWSYGLRNPFRFSFDRLSGDLTIGDVGQAAREEVDFAPAPLLGAGANYGWSCREGLMEGPADDPLCSTPGPFVDPVFDYPHTPFPGSGVEPCAIIGGYVARDPSLGDLYGRYLYADLCTGELRSIDLADPFGSDRSEGLVVDDLNSFGEDSAGRLYAVSGNGSVFRLAGPAPPPFTPTTATDSRIQPFLRIKSVSRRVERGRRVLITAFLSPCASRNAYVRLTRGRRSLGSRHLNRVCSVRFSPRIWRRSDFRATLVENATYRSTTSRRLVIKPKPRR